MRQYIGQNLTGPACTEGLQLCTAVLLRADVHELLGDNGSVSSRVVIHCSFGYLLMRPLGSNLQATLHNGGPVALAWGILIVVAGALAQSASLAEMSSAQPIAGAQYVSRGLGRTSEVYSSFIAALDSCFRAPQVSVASSHGCRAG